MMKATEWAEGTRCELHDLSFCADCQARLGLRRGSAGSGEAANSFFFTNDCGVASLRELTGAGYDEAVEMLGEGFSPRMGTDPITLKNALEGVGYRLVANTAIGIDGARIASLDGRRSFLVIGRTRKDAHAWTVTEGRVNRDFLRGRVYFQIFEIVA